MTNEDEDRMPAIPVTEFIARNAEAGNYQLVDIAGERAKDKLMGVEEFADRISKYTLKDYLHTDKPYNDLLECSRAQPGLFEQFAGVLIAAARSRVHAQNAAPYEKTVADNIAFYRNICLPDLTDAVSILDLINRVEADPETADKVSVLPLICGSGKSTAITLKIKEVIEHGEGLGMLIVTDSKKRLDEIWNENTASPLLGEDVRSFIREHKDDVTVMIGDTYMKAVQDEKKHPVLAMTTQRFFHILTKEEIRDFLTWNNGGTRPLILFDEEPYLNEVVDLTPKTVNDIDTMLRMVLNEENVSREDKQWCIRQWEAFRERFLERLWEYEYDHEGDMFYYEDSEHALTENDDRFFHIIDQCRTDIRSDNIDNFRNIYAFKALADTWGVYSHRTTGEYESKVTIFLDHRDKVQDLGAKVIVLDATGDISPTYAGQDYIDMRSGHNFVRSLSHLTIKAGDIDTSKRSMFGRTAIPRTIMSYLSHEGYNRENAYLFTYKDKENKFVAFRDRTAHFGNIKGSNDYAEAACIAQVGLNEMQPVHYLVQMLARNEEIRAGLSELSPEESCAQMHSFDWSGIQVAHILADIDQNMFRSAIRSAQNRRDIVFYLFYKHERIQQLQAKIHERYCGLLGGHYDSISAETLAEYMPEDNRLVEKIYKWYCEWDGSLKKRGTIAAEIDVDPDVFKTTVSRDVKLKELFEQAKAKGKEITGKNGYYTKREH